MTSRISIVLTCLIASLLLAPTAQAELVLAKPPAAPPPLLVDITATPAGDQQAGWDEFVGAVNDGTTTQTETFATTMGVAGTVDVTLSGNTHYRDYAPITGGPFLGQTNLLDDHILRNTDGTMSFTLDDLADGEYTITTYHHNTQFGGGEFDIVLTDAVVTSDEIFSDLVTTAGTTPASITTATFGFQVSGGSSVLIEFPADVSGNHFSFNGFELNAVLPPPLAPEPSSFVLFGVLIGAAGFYYRRRRRLARATG